MTADFDAVRTTLQAIIAEKQAATPPAPRGDVVIGLLGRGIQASRSPAMHEREGTRQGFRYAYVLVDFDALHLDDADLEAAIGLAERLGFAGLNVTHPFKQAVLPHLHRLSPEAAAIGAVNTVVLRDGRRTGHNTDSWGFAESFGAGLPGAAKRAVVQFGAGGAGAAVAHALLSAGVEKLSLYDTDLARAAALAARLSEHFTAPVDLAASADSAMAAADGVVNATPIGMDKYPGLPFPRRLLRRSQWVAEIVYFPPETELLRVARQVGCQTLAGTGMAVYQAVKAFELFTGVAPDSTHMLRHFAATDAP